MTDQLRTLAETEAKRLNLDAPHHVGYIKGFIAGRTSVTREQIDAAVAGVTDKWDEPLDEVHDIPQIRRAILALLNGDTDDPG